MKAGVTWILALAGELPSAMARVLAPPACALCSGPLRPAERRVCALCLQLLPALDFHERPQANPAYYKLAGLTPAAGAAAAYVYRRDGALRRIVRQFKYGGRPGLAYEMGRVAGVRMAGSAFAEGFSIIAPIPLHPRRFRERGYNQSERLTAGLADALGKRAMPDLLRRTRHNPSQTGLSREARRRNVAGIFELRRPVPPGAAVLLVDDVLTSGATMAAAVLALSAGPDPPAVYVFTLGCAMR